MKMTYQTTGTCSSKIELELEDGVLGDIAFTGGCNGNLQGIAALVKGMDAREAAQKLRGLRCGTKKTSCPDQLALAIEQALVE